MLFVRKRLCFGALWLVGLISGFRERTLNRMVGNNPQRNHLTPFQVVLMTFEHFKVPAEGAIEKQGLVRCMQATGCPRVEVAEGIIQRMVEEGLLQRRLTEEHGEVYARTPKGIRATPPFSGT